MNRVIITWWSNWLWLELSKTFIEKWFEVISLSRNKPNIPSIHLETDLTDEYSINKTVEEIKEKYSNFSTIICCAGIWYIEKIDSINHKNTDNMFKVNIIWQAYLLSNLTNLIKDNNADLIFVGATIWYKGNEFMPMYSVTKRWLRWLIENRRNELKNNSCRVIGIHPWWMNTESNIGIEGRETIISNITWKKVWTLLDKTAISNFIYNLTQLPKNMEVSEIIINRK